MTTRTYRSGFASEPLQYVGHGNRKAKSGQDEEPIQHEEVGGKACCWAVQTVDISKPSASRLKRNLEPEDPDDSDETDDPGPDDEKLPAAVWPT